MKSTQEKFHGLLFCGSGRSNRQFFYLVHILCSCTRQYECDDVLDGFLGPGDSCRPDAGSETAPGQILRVLVFEVWDSFANIVGNWYGIYWFTS